MRKIYVFALAAVLGLSVTACGGKKKSVSADDRGVNASGLADGAGTYGSAIGDLLSQRRVYFDFDSAELTEESRAIVEAHASHLANKSGINLVLEGHADERGTREYNLALGERRGNAVASIMQALGVAGHQIQSISYGEERPVALEHNESAWALNRRVEILYGN